MHLSNIYKNIKTFLFMEISYATWQEYLTLLRLYNPLNVSGRTICFNAIFFFNETSCSIWELYSLWLFHTLNTSAFAKYFFYVKFLFSENIMWNLTSCLHWKLLNNPLNSAAFTFFLNETVFVFLELSCTICFQNLLFWKQLSIM